MSAPDYPSDRIFARPHHFTLHYRRARKGLWAWEARPDYAALVVLGGRARWETCEGKGEAGEGAALLNAPGEPLTAAPIVEARCLLITLAPLFVHDCAARSGLARAGSYVSFPERFVERDEKLARLASDLTEELFAAEAGQEVVVGALAEQAAVHLLRRHANARRAEHLELSRVGLVDRRVRRAVELMHAHLGRDLTLEELAAAAHLSPFHFSRLFKKLIGATPHAHLASLRAARAQELLAATDLSITEVGARVGYMSSSHFAKAFRQATGLSPRAFRKALVRP